MLFVNNEKYELTAADTKAVREFVGHKFPVTLKWPEKMYSARSNMTMGMGKQSRVKRDRPPLTLIPMKSQIFDNGRSELWIYSDMPPKLKKDSDPIYSPMHIELDEVAQIDENRIDLLFFLIFKSNVRDGSPYLKPGGRPMFRIENREAERESRVKIKKFKSRVEDVLYNKIKDKDLLDIALAMQIQGASLMGPNEQREAIEAKLARANTVEAYEKFMQLCKADDESQKNEKLPLNKEVKKLSLLQKAKEMQLISYDKQLKSWWFLDSEKKRTGKVCEVLAGMDEEQSLLFAIEKDPSIMNSIEDGLKVKEPEEKEVV